MLNKISKHKIINYNLKKNPNIFIGETLKVLNTFEENITIYFSNRFIIIIINTLLKVFFVLC